jgi:hypothetical protein
MPKRSNDFQRLIRRIYEQLFSTAAKVIESAMLTDLNSGEKREIDILVEVPTPGTDTPTRIAIECRDHERASDVTWIDSLVGKYRDLPVNRVIAVSRKAFTKSAARKAQRNNIETRTLAEALATDWPEDLFSVDFSNVVHWPVVTDVSVVANPPWRSDATATAVRLGNLPVEAMGFAAWQRKCFAEAFAAAAQQQRRVGLSEFDSPGIHRFRAVISPPSVNVMIVEPDGTEHHVMQLTLSGEVTVEHHALKNERYRFGKVGVTRATGPVHGGDIDVLAVQEQGRRLSVRVTQTKKRR